MDSNAIITYFSYDIEYSSYKKKLIKQIFSQLDILYELFDEEFNENMVKVYIMLTNNKIPNEIKLFVVYFFELISDLNNIEHIDHYEFLNIIIILIKINKSIIPIDEWIQKNIIITKYVNWNLIKNKFNDCIKILSSNNKVVNLLIKLSDYDLKILQISHEHIKKNIIELSDVLSFDFFMYFSSTKILKYLFKKLIIDGNDIYSKYNTCSILLSKYKKYFITRYREKYECFIEIYYDIINSSVSKYKYNKKNNNFDELIKDILSIQQLND